MVKHFCGGQVIYNPEESFFWCRRCCKKFVSLEQVEEDNRIAEDSDVEYEFCVSGDGLKVNGEGKWE